MKYTLCAKTQQLPTSLHFFLSCFVPRSFSLHPPPISYFTATYQWKYWFTI
eukprot:m.70753 g.70753  ORF g.70753 m.70753 type:complete len:51 (-) comp12267_c0_seq2:1309-1461(-)